VNTALTPELGLDYLGLDYIFTHGRHLAKPRDTIILPLEYQLYLADVADALPVNSRLIMYLPTILIT
jgi:hypothetical protein